MNEQNLHPVRSESEAREKGRKGGIASGIKRCRNRRLRELISYLGTLPSDAAVRDELASMGIEDKMMCQDMEIAVALYRKAKQGDVAAFNAIRDIKGEKPTESLNVNLPSTVKIEIVDSDYDTDFAHSEEEVDASR